MPLVESAFETRLASFTGLDVEHPERPVPATGVVGQEGDPVPGLRDGRVRHVCEERRHRPKRLPFAEKNVVTQELWILGIAARKAREHHPARIRGNG